MTTVASAATRRSPIAEAFHRSPGLARLAVAFFALGTVTLILQSVDGRTLDGVNVWVKPTKFFVSIGVFAATHAWFFGYVEPAYRRSRLLRATVFATVASASLEMAYITLQAARGVASHFNLATPLENLAYSLMGLFAVILVGTTLPIAYAVARRPLPGLRPDVRAAVVVGLVLTFMLGGLLTFRMGNNLGHSVGATGGQLPILGWNRSGGDLRVAHFFGMHLEQVLPLLMALAAPLALRLRWAILAVGAAAGTAVTLATFSQALRGEAFLPWLG